MSAASNSLTFGSRIGVFILAEISAVSACAVIILLGYIAYSAISIRSGSRRRWRIESPVHLFLLNQLVCDLIQALGGLMNMKWVFDGTVHPGSFCTAQGLIKQLADVGTALSAGNVAIFTFSTLIFRLNPDTNVFRALLIVAGIWVSIILNVTINVGINGASRFYGPTGPWCWIVEEFHIQRTVADFMWMWISAFSSLLAYLAVFLVLKGFITVEGWRVRWTYGQESPDIPRSHALAYKMLAYPIIYIITVGFLVHLFIFSHFDRSGPPFGCCALQRLFGAQTAFRNNCIRRWSLSSIRLTQRPFVHVYAPLSTAPQQRQPGRSVNLNSFRIRAEPKRSPGFHHPWQYPRCRQGPFTY
ncbi:hypothetical protein H4582DRAFT_1913234 [Lactarius indigo]|nr:hypothetical protein H4582DRAFT_1913234 [Lactarius indigo]